jgi:hypothetical protein
MLERVEEITMISLITNFFKRMFKTQYEVLPVSYDRSHIKVTRFFGIIHLGYAIVEFPWFTLSRTDLNYSKACVASTEGCYRSVEKYKRDSI